MSTFSFGGLAYTTNELKVYPSLAAATTFTSSATAWNWGAWTEIVPASTITNAFLIFGAFVTNTEGVTRQWQVQIGTGAAASEVSKINLAGESEADTSADSGLWTPPVGVYVVANARVAMRATDNEAGANTFNGRIYYVELPL